ncbi:DUF484 family protein, partial [Salmonella enterica]|uniref:DUF484 family protein n=1 Tax=Salmonella enterica TaxID=28901 RepID=UPI00398C706F
MEQPEEELQETLTELDDRAVVAYLRHPPEFFIRHAHAVEAMRFPLPVRGPVSLVWLQFAPPIYPTQSG